MNSGGSTITPPVGKSGPGTYLRRVRLLALGVAMRCSAASQSSAALCGGIDVAIPTAIPWEPLASRLGNAPGRTTGSFSDHLVASFRKGLGETGRPASDAG